jgi:hypothetical protein
MRFLKSTVTIAAVAALSSGTSGIPGGRAAAAGKAQDAQSGAWPSRTADGQPDIQGLWANDVTAAGTTSIEPGSYLRTIGMPRREVPTPGHAGNNPRPALNSEELAKGILQDPPDHILPYQPWAKARRDEVMRGSLHPTPEEINPLVRGWPNGVPRENYYRSHDGDIGGPFQILQPPGSVVFFYETHHEFRIVPLDGRPHVGRDIKLWEGDSRGRWEGHTLVVDVTNNNDSTRFDNVGDFHSDAMRVTERWTIIDRDTIDYKATIDDPKVYTRPWTLGVKLTRNRPGSELIESAAVEGDTAVREAEEIERARAK